MLFSGAVFPSTPARQNGCGRPGLPRRVPPTAGRRSRQAGPRNERRTQLGWVLDTPGDEPCVHGCVPLPRMGSSVHGIRGAFVCSRVIFYVCYLLFDRAGRVWQTPAIFMLQHIRIVPCSKSADLYIAFSTAVVEPGNLFNKLDPLCERSPHF